MGFNEPPSVGFFNRVDTQPLKNLHAHLIILPYYAKKIPILARHNGPEAIHNQQN